MKSNAYECMWCDEYGVFNYKECADETEVKVWFHEMIVEGFYNLTVYKKEMFKNEG